MHPIVHRIRADLHKHADPEIAGPMAAYMKGVQPFLGIKAPERRTLFRAAKSAHPIQSANDYNEVVVELWQGQYREERYQALEVVTHVKPFRNVDSWPLFEELVHTADWWDTLDWVAGKIVSLVLLASPEKKVDVRNWTASPHMWTRRASLLAHLRHKDQTNTSMLSDTILALSHEKEFFIRKAIGWVLREYAKTDPNWVKAFTETHGEVLSPLSRREALRNL